MKALVTHRASDHSERAICEVRLEAMHFGCNLIWIYHTPTPADQFTAAQADVQHKPPGYIMNEMSAYQAEKKAIEHAQSLPAGQERAKCYEISSAVRSAGIKGVAFAVANQHRSEIHIREAIYRCVRIGIAEEVSSDKVVFFDSSSWEPDGCTPAPERIGVRLATPTPRGT
jgi:hypothetical protein